MKHHAQQFEIPGTGDTFNLAGETQSAPQPATSKPDPEQDGLFSDDAMGSEEAVLAHFNQPSEEREFHEPDACGAFAPVVWGNGTTGLRCRICGQPEGAHQ